MYKYRKETFVPVCCIFFLLSCSGAEPQDPRHAFFDLLQSHCGQQFTGEGTYPDDPGHELIGTPLVATVESCTDEEVRIPLRAGEDRSRTWIIRKTGEGLLLKHDHRDPDTGREHELTNYGGIATTEGSAGRQFFAADAETAEMLPEAATNVWMMELNEEDGRFIYYLERHGEPRFRAELHADR